MPERAKTFFQKTNKEGEPVFDWFKLLLTVFMIPLIGAGFKVGEISAEAKRVTTLEIEFKQHTEEAERRFQNLEKIISDGLHETDLSTLQATGQVITVATELSAVKERLGRLEEQVNTLIDLQIQKNSNN